MSKSMKEALLNLGLKSSKSQNEREKRPAKSLKETEKHQQSRNFCEVCELVQPDVEKYKHRNPTIDAEWICAACADKNQILDDFRHTHQSDFAKKGRFRREFGHTKDFSALGGAKDNTKKKGNFRSNGNRSQTTHSGHRSRNSNGNSSGDTNGNR